MSERVNAVTGMRGVGRGGRARQRIDVLVVDITHLVVLRRDLRQQHARHGRKIAGRAGVLGQHRLPPGNQRVDYRHGVVKTSSS